MDDFLGERNIDVQLADTMDEAADIIDNDKPAKPEPPAVPVDEASALGPPRHVELTIVAQDPKVKTADGKILRAKVKVAADRWRPPFQTHRFNVISFDPQSGQPGPELKMLGPNNELRDRFATVSDDTLLKSHEFHAQNVFAVASRTLSAFEGALGRRVPWSFGWPQLYLVPHGEIAPNAGYSPDKHAVIFGIVPESGGGNVYTCLSQDVIAHETTHAILDGLRPGYFTPGLADQGGFHEGFADLVALLSVFSVPEVLDLALSQVTESRLINIDDVTRRKLMDGVLLGMAEEFGEVFHGQPGMPLRQSVKLRAGGWWRTDKAYERVHERGEVLVAAVANALLDMWLQRLKQLLENGPAPRTLAAEEGAKAAEHLLGMLIRAIDYCPPLEFEFEDFLDAVMRADQQIVPDDAHHYRRSVLDAFKRYDIGLPPQRSVVVDRLKVRPVYDRFNFGALQTDKDEVFRFIWENDELLSISLDVITTVESLYPSVRVGPDGFVVHETVVTYRQWLDGTAAELREFSTHPQNRYLDTTATFIVPETIATDQPMRIWGGGAVIFDQFGRPKFHLHKPLLDWDRQSRRLKFLAGRAQVSAGARLGATRRERNEPFFAMHEQESYADERW